MKTNPTTKTLALLAGAAVFAGTQMSACAQTLIHQWNFNETSGTSAANTVGGGPSATLMGGAVFNGAGGVPLNATSGTYVNRGGGLLTGLSSVSFQAWFSYSQTPNNVGLFAFDDGTGTGSFNGGYWNGKYLRYNLYDTGNGHGGTNFVEVTNLGNPGGGYLHPKP